MSDPHSPPPRPGVPTPQGRGDDDDDPVIHIHAEECESDAVGNCCTCTPQIHRVARGGRS